MPAKKQAARKASPKRITHHQGRTTASAPPPITSAAEWGGEARENRVKGRPVTVPSGKTCLVKMLDSMGEFLARGDVPNALLPLMMEAATGKTESAKKVTDEVLGDPDKLVEMFALVDTIVVECVLQPPVAPVPQREVMRSGEMVLENIPAHEREDDDTLYVDYIELEDKMFIFNYALSGVNDVEQFRSQLSESMVSVSAVDNVE